MATLLFGGATKTKIGALELDVSVSESHQADVDVTDHPVERGANISDHARSKPAVLTLEGIVSNTPLGETDPTAGADRAGDALAQLLALKDAHEFLTVITALRTYRNMLITSLSVPRDSRTGEALRFSVTLKEILLADVQARTVVVPKALSARPKVDKGKQVAGEATDAQQKSVWYKLNDGLGVKVAKPPHVSSQADFRRTGVGN